MYVDSVELHDLRCFERTAVELVHPTTAGRREPSPRLANVTLLLGDNGSGKTTLLRAIALATLGPLLASSSGYVPFSLVRRVERRPAKRALIRAAVVFHGEDRVPGGTARDAELAAELRPVPGAFNDRLIAEGEPYLKVLFDEQSPGFFVLGYGATRRVEASAAFDEVARRKQRVLRYQRVAGLFEEHVSLIPLSAWLPRLEPPALSRQVVQIIDELLPDGCSLAVVNEGELLFRQGGALLPFSALSDGYRAFLGWIGDLLYHVCMGARPDSKLRDARGVVLVDEVDLHLHPEWQRVVVQAVSRALPNLQFVFTTHSPLVAGTLASTNLRVMRQKGDRIVVELPGEEVYGRSADQILTSSTFGLESTRDPEFVVRLRAVSERAKEGDIEASLQLIDMLSDGGVPARNGLTSTGNGTASTVRRGLSQQGRSPVQGRASGRAARASAARAELAASASGARAKAAVGGAKLGSGSRKAPRASSGLSAARRKKGLGTKKK